VLTTNKLLSFTVGVAVGILVDVLDGVGARVAGGFLVGGCKGAGVAVGMVIDFDPLVLVAIRIMVGELVADARANEVALGGKVSAAKLGGAEAGGDPRVRPKPRTATAAAIKRTVNPNNQRALRI